MPAISNIVVDLTTDDSPVSIKIIRVAPNRAPTKIDIVVLPTIMTAKATPRLAPEETPIIDGPANGLSRAVCMSSPAIARAMPETAAVITMGNLSSMTIFVHVKREHSPPARAVKTSLAGILTGPDTRHAIAKISASALITANDMLIRVGRVTELSLIRLHRLWYR